MQFPTLPASATIAFCLRQNSHGIRSGYNIFSDDTCPATGTGDLINTDPLLGELGWWGGPTMTLPLLYGSPAIDHRDGIVPI